MAANPNPSRITDEMWYLWEQLHELEPTTQLGGIYANKPGYHDTRNANNSSDYSVTDKEDQGGPGDKAAAIDWTFPDAQSGDYTRIKEYSKRLLDSGQDPNDARMDGWREFYGQADTDTAVEGWDFRYARAASSDSSHLWHIHLSCDRDKVTSKENMDKLLEVLRGDDVALTTADAQLVVSTWIKATMSSDALGIANQALGNWLKDGEYAQRAAEANGKAITELATKVDQILAILNTGIPVPGAVTLTAESQAAVADAVADEVAGRLDN